MSVCSLSHVWLFAAQCTVTRQAPLPVELSRQEYWSGVPFPTPGDLPEPRTVTVSLASPPLASRFSTTGTIWTSKVRYCLLMSESEVQVLVTQSCPTLCDPMDCSLPGSSGILQTRILKFLLQGMILTQGSNPALLHCRQILYHLSHQGCTLEDIPKSPRSVWQICSFYTWAFFSGIWSLVLIRFSEEFMNILRD